MAEKLTPQQETAVRDRGGKLLVSAAAGSGKTKVLVDRLMSYITDPVSPANIDDFLIITYTKAAAAELRGKIARKLTELIAQQPQNYHLQQQMRRLYLAKISTVHEFCSGILREFAYRLDIPADFRVGDEKEIAALQERTLAQVLEQIFTDEQGDADFFSFLDMQGLNRDDSTIGGIILWIYEASRAHLDPDGWLNQWTSTMDPSALTDAAETPWGAYLVEDLQRFLRWHIRSFRKCGELAASTDNMEKPAALFESTAEQLECLLEKKTWDEIYAHPDIDFGTLRFHKNTADEGLVEFLKGYRKKFKDDFQKKMEPFRYDSKAAFSGMQSTFGPVRGLVGIARRYSQAFQSAKQRLHIMDFSDLEQATVQLFWGKRRDGITAAAREIGKRFREVMVDEYQDSNAVQEAIFGALTEQRQNCFMVGDVKQSIYQFRLANPELFLKKYDEYAPAGQVADGEPRKVVLSNNFRSSAGILSAVNDVFSCCMTKQVGGIQYGAEESLYEGLPHIPLNEPEVSLHCLEVLGNDTYGEEAAYTAQRIKTLLDGTHMVRDGENLRPITPDDIVILLRAPSALGGEFKVALENLGIRCTTGKTLGLFLSEEVTVLRALLQVISNPLQDIPLVTVLASRIFGFTADDLAKIRGSDKRRSFYLSLLGSEHPKVKEFVSVLSDIRKRMRLLPLTELIQYVLNVTRLDSIYAAMPNGTERSGNINAFFQMAAAFTASSRKTLEQFLEHLELQEGVSQSADLPAPSGAVRITSIHKSKGLEFPVVFLCALSNGFILKDFRKPVLYHKELGIGMANTDIQERYRYPSLTRLSISNKKYAEMISEEMRILYVAMTRARDRMEMVYSSKSMEEDLKTLARQLDVCDHEQIAADVRCMGDWVLMAAMQRTEAGALFIDGEKPAHTSVSQHPWKIDLVHMQKIEAAEVPQEGTAPMMEPGVAKRIGEGLSFRYAHAQASTAPSKITATQLKDREKDYESAEYARTEPGGSRRWREPEFVGQTESPTKYGTLLHRALQYISYGKCDTAEGLETELKRLAASGILTNEETAKIRRKELLEFFCSPLGKRLQSSSRVIREFKFSVMMDASNYVPGLTGEQVMLQGVVDCAILDDDGITVIDFKTDRITAETLDETAAKYASQVRAYAEALSRIYQMPVKEKYLYFFRLSQAVCL